MTLTLTSYLSTDLGGWAALPSDPTRLPWTTGPLSPESAVRTVSADELASVDVELPPVSLTVASFS